MQVRITIIDIDIRSSVLRRMFAGMREPDAAERREIMARYVASDAADARMMYWCEECRAADYLPAESVECDAYARDPNYKA